jgi:hypothetical protein
VVRQALKTLTGQSKRHGCSSPECSSYFNGEALWTYLTTPFLLAMDGVRVVQD